jgi:hypothetical protein
MLSFVLRRPILTWKLTLERFAHLYESRFGQEPGEGAVESRVLENGFCVWVVGVEEGGHVVEPAGGVVAWGDEDELFGGAGVESWSGEGGHFVLSGWCSWGCWMGIWWWFLGTLVSF